jgi:hypothetical protein
MLLNKLLVTLLNMKKIRITVIFCLISFSLLSQTSKIENTRVILSPSIDTMYVKYDLTGKQEASITLEVTDQNKKIIKPKNISGDIGKNIQPGKDKTMIWNMNADGIDLSGSSLKVKVKGNVFIPTVEKKIKYTPSKWGCELELFSGYGILTDDLAKTFRNIVPIGFDGGIYYKRLFLNLRDYIGFSKTIRDVPYSYGIWAKGSQVIVYLPEASLGYVLAENKIIKFAPIIGIAGTNIGPTKSDLNNVPGLTEVEFGFTTTYLLGLNLDFKIKPSKTPALSAELEQGHLFIRVRYSYSLTQFNNRYPGFSGNIHNITIGIGGFSPRLKRKY